MNNDKIQIIILAAGLGKRMNHSLLPKVLITFMGKPIISYLLEAVKQSGVCGKPVIVVGQKAEIVKDRLGPSYEYIYQKEQLGTGHAVSCCRNYLGSKTKNIMVLYGDHPLLKDATIKRLCDAHIQSDNVITMATVTIPDFNNWRSAFYNWGRIIRDSNNEITGIVEMRDASEKQRLIKEVNPSFFCFRAEWLWNNIGLLNNKNASGEYYLTDLIDIAFRQGEKIHGVKIEAEEAPGINTPSEFEHALSVQSLAKHYQ